MSRYARIKHETKWTGPERRSVPRVFKRNVGQAKLLVTLAALAVTLGGWLGFAVGQPDATPRKEAPAHNPTPTPHVPSSYQPFTIELANKTPGNGNP